jgi:hypothetical protein
MWEATVWMRQRREGDAQNLVKKTFWKTITRRTARKEG